ncbi:intracellular short-chain-length polyhydroxyalkanoate depolymerase [Maledivibacter halophilus]|uniref:Pimeloyl-ACP methyl ester carboxylesterase n=1 Tax=Maledivibacter halophilus TaxID=36842 RepID=A0A1T5J9B7_9FIRM|nr:alpha/beta hydrolase [Maledivibacter halophilus]SKC48137.1 Pimeloyl-ACP methyl ester carboxylesterase [Maledivibacter halophilus]
MKIIEIKKITLLNGETYRYRQYIGGEKNIVLLHGNLASSKFYDELIQDLPEEYTVYAMDMRGLGGSTYNRPIDTLRDFAGDLKLFVDKLGLEKFDLLGWSTGGAVSMLFCSSYGYMVNRLFLIASAPASGYHSYAVDAHGNKTLLKSKKEIQEDPIKIELLRALENKDRDYYKKVWSAAIYNKKKPDPELYDIHLEESLLQKNLIDVYYGLAKFNISKYYNGLTMGTEEVDRINMPTIIVQGKDDLLVCVDEARELKESIGNNAKLVVVEDCGHSPMIDAPELLVKVISES